MHFGTDFYNFDPLFLLQCPCDFKVKRINLHWQQNRFSLGPETSIPKIEKLKAQLPFQREDFSFPRLDSCQTERMVFQEGYLIVYT